MHLCLGLKDIDSYYRKFVDDAIDDISQYCNFDWFVSEVEYDKENNQIIPF